MINRMARERIQPVLDRPLDRAIGSFSLEIMTYGGRLAVQ
jgi:hypothetical protein